MKKRHIVFVCTGNICRSPMAEYILKDKLQNDPGWIVSSAGLLAVHGMPPSVNACRVMEKTGIDISAHKSRPLSVELIDSAALIVVMTSAHAEQIKAMVPEADEKTFLLKAFLPDCTDGDTDIADPMGGDVKVYTVARDEINRCIPGLLDFVSSIE